MPHMILPSSGEPSLGAAAVAGVLSTGIVTVVESEATCVTAGGGNDGGSSASAVMPPSPSASAVGSTCATRLSNDGDSGSSMAMTGFTGGIMATANEPSLPVLLATALAGACELGSEVATDMAPESASTKPSSSIAIICASRVRVLRPPSTTPIRR